MLLSVIDMLPSRQFILDKMRVRFDRGQRRISVRDLMDDTRYSDVTIRFALMDLEREGLIERRRTGRCYEYLRVGENGSGQ